MGICPLCQTDLGDAKLPGGRCSACGGLAEWSQTLAVSPDDLTALMGRLEHETPAEPEAGDPDRDALRANLQAIVERGSAGREECSFTMAAGRNSPERIISGETGEPNPPVRAAPVSHPTPRVLEATMLVTPEQLAGHADGVESAVTVPVESTATLAFEPPIEPPTQYPQLGETTLLPVPSDPMADTSPRLPNQQLPVDPYSSPTVKAGGATTRDSQLFIKPRVVSHPMGEPTGEAPHMPDYELLKVLGQGGMGVVYAARQTSVDRTVAVKMLNRETAGDAGHRDKFLSEAVVTGDLDHPNIVAIYELGTNAEGALFYSMKCVQGTPWVKVIAKKTLPENLEILMKVADAVAFAHSRGVVHRDIKPENVMLGEFGEVLLMDWGMALATPEFRKAGSISPTNTIGGTPAYMAPEMATGPLGVIGPASDIYLLGATLFEILTGDPPHTGDTVMSCLRSAMKNEIRPTQHSSELLDIAYKAMATKSADRFPTVRRFQDAIRRAVSHSESVVLSTKAEQHLAEAQESGDYQTYSRALFGFQEAIALWEGNKPARSMLLKAQRAYAERALNQEDYDLASSLLDPDEPEHADLWERLLEARKQRDARDRRLTNIKRIAVGLAASIFVLGSVAYNEIRKERDRSQVAERQAKEDRDMALVMEGKATSAQKLEKVAAEKARTAAREAEQSALKEKKSAEEAQRSAQTAREESEKARLAKEAEEYEAYVARIGLAAAKIDENAFDQAAQLLADCEARFRHWEWGRLSHLCTQSVYSFEVDKPINSIDVSADGNVLATASWDGAARLWSLPARKLLRAIPYGATYVNAVAISPDGKQLATGGSDQAGYLKLWDAESGQLLKTYAGHTDAVMSVKFSTDGHRLLTSSYDKTARLWDTSTGQTIQVFRGHTWWVWNADFAPDEKSIVTASQDRTVRIWPIASGESGPPFTGHAGAVYAATFSPDGKRVATGGYDNQILLFEPGDLRAFDFEKLSGGESSHPQKFRAFHGHTAPVRSVQFSPDGTRLLSGSDDNTIRIWDVERGELLKTLRGHAGWVRSCEFSPDGHWILSGSHDHTAKLWSIANYEEVRISQARVFQGHTDAILSAAFSPDGQQIATASRDRTARLWDLSLAQELHKFEEGHQYLATSAIFFPEGKKLLTSAGDNTTVIWDVANGTQLLRLEPTGRSAAIALTRDGQQILTGGENQTAQLWDAQSGQLLQTFRGQKEEVTAVACSPTGQIVATGDAAGLCVLWDKSKEKPLQLLRGHAGRINSMVFLPDGSRLLTASDDKTVAQWDVATGQEVKPLVLRHPDSVTSLALAADGRTLLTSCADGLSRWWDVSAARTTSTLGGPNASANAVALSGDGRYALAVSPRERMVRVWDLQTKKEISASDGGAFLAGQAGAVWSAAFSPSGAQLVTVAGTGARLWDLATRSELMSFSPNGAVAAVQFAPDGKSLVTGSSDGTARIWNTASGKAELKLRSDRYVNAVAFSPDGTLLLVGTDEPRAKLCDARTGKLVRWLPGHQGRVTCVAFSAAGERALTGSDDRTARLWDVATGRQLLELRAHQQGVVCVAFERAGHKVITGSDDKTAIVWDATTGAKLLSLEGHTAGVTSVGFAPDGRRALTASLDATAKLWDIDRPQFGDARQSPGNSAAGLGKELISLKAHRQPLTSVSFSPDGRYVLTASRDGTAILWLATDWRRAAPAEQQASTGR